MQRGLDGLVALEHDSSVAILCEEPKRRIVVLAIPGADVDGVMAAERLWDVLIDEGLERRPDRAADRWEPP